jgi:hypothetical protein
MTEERFWELADTGSRVLITGLGWLVFWPFLLIGLIVERVRGQAA